jgi:hypothetical protein
MHSGLELKGGKKLMDYDKIVQAGEKAIDLFAIPCSQASLSSQIDNSAQAAALALDHSVKIEPMSISSPVRTKSLTDFGEWPFLVQLICFILLIPFLMIYGVFQHAKANPKSFFISITTFFVFETIGILHVLKEPYYAQVNFLGMECDACRVTATHQVTGFLIVI